MANVMLNIHEYSTKKSFDYKIQPNGIVDWLIPMWDSPDGRRIGWSIFNAAIFDEIQKSAGTLKAGEYWRFTNNKNEIKLLRAGELENSTNHAENICEAGLSASQYAGYGIMGYRYCYKIAGTIIATGSDGEPVLDMKSIIPITRMMNVSAIGKKIDASSAKAKIAWCEAHGWAEGQLKIILDSCLPTRERMKISILKGDAE